MNNSEGQTQEPVGGMDWIDVNDRLPIEEKYYHTKGSDMCCYWHSDTKKFDLKGVTHWLDESYTPPDVEGWINVENCLPELNLEYNVAWDVDGGELVTTTMEFNVKSKSWYDVINGGVDVTEQVKFWMPLPKPPKAGYSASQKVKNATELFRDDFQAYADRILRDKGASNKDVFDAINDTIQELSKKYNITILASLPQSSTEEEKELWEEVANVLYGFEMGRRFDMNELLSTYKLSKR